MTAQIIAFPVARHVGLVDQLTLGYVERLDQRGAGVPYLQKQFTALAKVKAASSVSETDIRAELLDLLLTIAHETHRLFDIDMSGVSVDVPTVGASFLYDRATKSA